MLIIFLWNHRTSGDTNSRKLVLLWTADEYYNVTDNPGKKSVTEKIQLRKFVSSIKTNFLNHGNSRSCVIIDHRPGDESKYKILHWRTNYGFISDFNSLSEYSHSFATGHSIKTYITSLICNPLYIHFDVFIHQLFFNFNRFCLNNVSLMSASYRIKITFLSSLRKS